MPAMILGKARFIDRLAKRYIKLYRSKGAGEAKKWALEFLAPGPRDDMSRRVNELLGRTT